MSWGEKEMVDTDLEFSLWFSVVVLTCLFADFVFTGSRLVYDPISKLIPNVGRNFRLSSHCPGLCLFTSLPLLHPAANFRTWVIPLLPLGVRGRTYRFRWYNTCKKDLGPPGVFVIFTYRSYSLMTGWPTTSALGWLIQVSWLLP